MTGGQHARWAAVAVRIEFWRMAPMATLQERWRDVVGSEPARLRSQLITDMAWWNYNYMGPHARA